MTDLAVSLLFNGAFTAKENPVPKRIILFLKKKQNTKDSVLRFETTRFPKRMIMPFEIPIYEDACDDDWLPWEKALGMDIGIFKSEQASYWLDCVWVNEKEKKVYLTKLGEELICGKLRVEREIAVVFREICAFLLMKVCCGGAGSDMAVLHFVGCDTSVRAISVQLIAAKQIKPIDRSAYYEPATVRLLPLFLAPFAKIEFSFIKRVNI